MNVSPELSFTHKDPAYDQFQGARKLYLKRKWKLISTTLVASLCSIQVQLFPTYIRRQMKQMLITCHIAVNNPLPSPARGFPSCHAKLFSIGCLHFSLELDRSLRGSRRLVFWLVLTDRALRSSKYYFSYHRIRGGLVALSLMSLATLFDFL